MTNTLQTTVKKFETDVARPKEQCMHLQGHMRRSNIRIMGVAENLGSSSTSSVSKLLKEALNLDKDVLVDRSHRGLKQESLAESLASLWLNYTTIRIVLMFFGVPENLAHFDATEHPSPSPQTMPPALLVTVPL
jgi:hypothetical protein